MTKKHSAAIIGLVAVLVLVAVLAAGCGSASKLPSSDMAKVGKVIITTAQFNQRVADFEKQYAGQVPDQTSDPSGFKDFQRSVLDYMVTYQIVVEQSAALKISVTDQEVQAQVDSIVKSSFSGDQTKFDAALKQQNITLDELKSSYREQLLLQKAYDEVTKSLTDSSVTQAEIQAYYDANKASYYTAETRDVRHILIAPTPPATSSSTSSTTSSSATTTTVAPTAAQWAAALATAEKVRADLVAGADWKTEAAKYSDDPGTKNVGGELGSITKGEMVAEFDAAAFSLAKGEISQPVKSVYGYHIIQVESITPAKQFTLDDVKSTILSTLLGNKKDAAWQAWITTMKQELGVTLQAGMATTTTTTASTTTSTTAGAATTATSATSTSPPATATTTSSSTATTSAGATTTAAP